MARPSTLSLEHSLVIFALVQMARKPGDSERGGAANLEEMFGSLGVAIPKETIRTNWLVPAKKALEQKKLSERLEHRREHLLRHGLDIIRNSNADDWTAVFEKSLDFPRAFTLAFLRAEQRFFEKQQEALTAKIDALELERASLQAEITALSGQSVNN